tara:strand:+ start:51 stop:662 length:612 start_codon:yes stop_codon:yes gene_type:complete
LIKRSSKKFIDKLLDQNTGWKILDIGCGFTAHKNANVVCDVQDLSSFYQNKKFVKLNDKILPFKDKEFDFVIASHVMEHVKNIDFFIKELQRVSSQGYIELPTILDDNLVFENKKEHLWQMEFDDLNNQLIVSKKIQYIEPLLTVSSEKKILKYFRQSLVLELFWKNSIEYFIKENDVKDYEKISRLVLFRKFISKIFRNIVR